MSRYAVFIDGGYLKRILEDRLGKPRIDFHTFSELLCRDAERLRTYYYYCMPYQHNPPTATDRALYSSTRKFMHKIEILPRFEVKLGKLKKDGDRYMQKGVDVQMSVDLVNLSSQHQIGTAVLITGDSDFVPAVQAAKNNSVVVSLYYVPGTTSRELLKVVDETHAITEELIDEARM